MSDERHTQEPGTGPGEDVEGSDEGASTDETSGGDRDPRDADARADRHDAGGLSDRAAFLISAVIALVLSVGAILLVSGRAPFHENLLRVRPTIGGGGVGTDWVVGNTMPALDFLIAFVHAADVLMGVFILLMVFVHWAAFRRLGARMRPPDAPARERGSTAATDGGSRGTEDRESAGGEHVEGGGSE